MPTCVAVLDGCVLPVYETHIGPKSGLATQAFAGRRLAMHVEEQPSPSASVSEFVKVTLHEDCYEGYASAQDLSRLTSADSATPSNTPAATEGRSNAASSATDYALQLARACKGYLWGGCASAELGLDCSGLVQLAYAKGAGWWIPRDAWMQEKYCAPVARKDVQRGDLVFFGSKERATHVAFVVSCEDAASLSLPTNDAAALYYLHCSGYDMGRGGCGVDLLLFDENGGSSTTTTPPVGASLGSLGIGKPGWSRSDATAHSDDSLGGVAQRYARVWRGFGRIEKRLPPNTRLW
ncbi:glycosyltransferase [Pycnococcus provasolii]